MSDGWTIEKNERQPGEEARLVVGLQQTLREGRAPIDVLIDVRHALDGIEEALNGNSPLGRPTADGPPGDLGPSGHAGRPRNPDAKYHRVAQFLLRADRPYTLKELRATLSDAPHNIELQNWHQATGDAIACYPDRLASWRDDEGVVFVGSARFRPSA